jgi:predicted DNA repair protein MutK
VVALAMTVFVYGLVAGIVKLDDVGLYLSRKGGPSPPSVVAWSPRRRG